MVNTEILRERAHVCELRAHSLLDRILIDDYARDACEIEIIVARVLLELAAAIEEAEQGPP